MVAHENIGEAAKPVYRYDNQKHEWRRVGKERKKSVWKAKRHGPKPGSRRGTYYYCPCCDKPFTSLGDVVQHLKDDGCLVGR